MLKMKVKEVQTLKVKTLKVIDPPYQFPKIGAREKSGEEVLEEKMYSLLCGTVTVTHLLWSLSLKMLPASKSFRTLSG